MYLVASYPTIRFVTIRNKERQLQKVNVSELPIYVNFFQF